MKHYLFILSLLLVSIFPMGCAVLNATDTGSMLMTYGDDEIKSSITSALLEKDPSKARDISVYAFNSYVFLIGKGDPEFKTLARSISMNTEGVDEVHAHWFDNESSDKMKDAALAADIDSKIFLDKDLSSTRMAVEVYDGHAVLCGVMPDKKSIEKLVNNVKSVPDVKSVTSYLIY